MQLLSLLNFESGKDPYEIGRSPRQLFGFDVFHPSICRFLGAQRSCACSLRPPG
jgi:hypothetical protein